MLLDPESMNGALEKNRFLELFYDDCIGKLSDALATSPPLCKVQHTQSSRQYLAVAQLSSASGPRILSRDPEAQPQFHSISLECDCAIVLNAPVLIPQKGVNMIQFKIV